MNRTRAMMAAAAIGSLLALTFVAGAGADNGDAFPKGPDVTTDPAVTGHVTTFDSIAPALDENAPPPGVVYVPGNTVPFSCTLSGIPGGGFPQWKLVGDNDNAVTLEGQVTSSKLAWDDNPIDHHSRDRNFFV